MRRLIINADDLGLTSGVNRAIDRAHREGVVTSTTLMANGRALAEAVSIAGANPRLSVGCHLQFVDGTPVLPDDIVETLVRDKHLRPSFGSFALDLLRKRIDTSEVEAEAIAQIGRLKQQGIAVSHVDSHKHIHMLPAVAEAVLRAAQACDVRAIRNPFTPVKPLAFAHLARRPKLWTRYSEVRILRGLNSRFRRMVRDAGMVTTDGSFGVVTTGALDAQLFRAIIGCIPEGTWEFVCHPGYNDTDLDHVRTRLRQSREAELQVLTSAEARDVLRDNGVELISYNEVAP